jgi:hypothetical protein
MWSYVWSKANKQWIWIAGTRLGILDLRKDARYMGAHFCALALCTIAALGFAQSADSKHPAPLQPGDNIDVVTSMVEIPHYYVTLGPGKGEVSIQFSANGFPGSGGQIRVCLLASGVKKNYSVVVRSTQVLFSSNAAQTGQQVIPFDIKQAM